MCKNGKGLGTRLGIILIHVTWKVYTSNTQSAHVYITCKANVNDMRGMCERHAKHTRVKHHESICERPSKCVLRAKHMCVKQLHSYQVWQTTCVTRTCMRHPELMHVCVWAYVRGMHMWNAVTSEAHMKHSRRTHTQHMKHTHAACKHILPYHWPIHLYVLGAHVCNNKVYSHSPEPEK